ncbi:MAG: lysophospholipid acyltransferase family protein [Gammaproteobacteria bacterium WSBS_2016_MAG_OTU1]
MLIFLQWIGKLPTAVRRNLGATLGDIVRILGVRRHVAMRNLQLALPHLSPAEHDTLLRQHFQFLGSVLLDEFFLLGASKQKILQLLQLENDQPQTRPTIFCAPHFAAVSMGGLRLSAAPAGDNLAFHYKPMHSKFWDLFYTRLRKKYGAIGIDATAPDAMRQCARHLRRGGSVFYLPDIDPKQRKSAVFVPFMGINAATTTTLSRLAKIGNAQVRVFVARKQGDNYNLHLSPPLEDFPSNDVNADACRINDIISTHIREIPEQYYWLHRRFKTRPPGEKDVYAR